jgi:hydrogenase nickel incorporation protein HypA/HybF
MHELSIAMSIVELAEEEGRKHHAGRVSAVHLRLGPLAGVVRDALESCYEMACTQTSLAGSRLLIEEVPIVIQCPSCKAPRPAVSIQQMECAVCHTPGETVVQGRELEVVALEIDS